ncbi:MAG: hypothetical protein AAF585_13405 [Verrucomicrobiota bacterium]
MSPIVRSTNRCSAQLVNPIFQSALKDAKSRILAENEGCLVDLRVMGSIARAEEKIPLSDLDLIAFVHQGGTLKVDRSLSLELSNDHPVVCQIVIHSGGVETLDPRTRHLIASDSASIWGEDLFPGKNYEWSREKICEWVRREPVEVDHEFRSRLESAKGPRLTICAYKVAKNLLRCFRQTAFLRGAEEREFSLGRLHRQLLDFVPEHRKDIEELYQILVDPNTGHERIVEILDRSHDWPLNS